MSAQSWANLPQLFLRAELQFTWDRSCESCTQIPPEHWGIFHWILQPKGKSTLYYFYGTTCPSLEEAWTEKISSGKEF